MLDIFKYVILFRVGNLYVKKVWKNVFCFIGAHAHLRYECLGWVTWLRTVMWLDFIPTRREHSARRSDCVAIFNKCWVSSTKYLIKKWLETNKDFFWCFRKPWDSNVKHILLLLLPLNRGATAGPELSQHAAATPAHVLLSWHRYE